MPYAMEFRVAVANAYDECGSSIEVAEQFGCSESWVRDLIARRRATGSLAPLPPRRPDTRKLDEQDLVRLRELIRDKPDMTLAELAHAMGNKASVPTVWRATRRLDLPLKKRPGTPASRTGPTSSSGVTTGSSSSPAWRSPGSSSSTSSARRPT
jgi:transposase